MSDNTAAEDRAVDAMSAKIREEYGTLVRSEWVRETFRLGLAAYNEIMNRPESTVDDDSAAPVDLETGRPVAEGRVTEDETLLDQEAAATSSDWQAEKADAEGNSEVTQG